MMRRMAAAALLVATPALAGEARTEQSVRAVEDRWSQAFMSGDAATLGALLDDRYVSVGTKGNARNKAEIIALAQRFAAANPGAKATPLPASSTIRVVGDAAVVTHQGPDERSVDVFYYRAGRWHAWYSQHTALAR